MSEDRRRQMFSLQQRGNSRFPGWSQVGDVFITKLVTVAGRMECSGMLWSRRCAWLLEIFKWATWIEFWGNYISSHAKMWPVVMRWGDWGWVANIPQGSMTLGWGGGGKGPRKPWPGAWGPFSWFRKLHKISTGSPSRTRSKIRRPLRGRFRASSRLVTNPPNRVCEERTW